MTRLALLAVAACGAPDATPHTASWTLSGDLVGARSADDTDGGRATCTASTDDDGQATLTLFFATRAGAGLHVTFSGFDAEGRYGLGADTRGVALVYDVGDLLECSRSARRCYAAASGCTVEISDWRLGERLPGAHAGVAHGTLSCVALANDRRGSVAVSGGTFTCRATDWR